MTRTTNSVPEPVGADMLGLLKTLKLGALADTLPQRAALARQHKTSHLTFLQQLLADEVSRRESSSAARRSAKAGLDPSMRIDNWRAADDLLYDRPLLEDLTTLRFIDAGHSAILLGPVGVGKTHLANALGHMAIGRRKTVLFARADKLFHRLKAARLDNSVDAELRRITAVDILIIDDFALRALDATETNDFYELIVERHQQTKTTIVTSNREPAEWLTMTADALLTQSAIDRLTSRAHTLVIEGPSYRQRHRPGLDRPNPAEHPQ
ncbi:IstB domain-containing protein ATP-binding protein [Gordonia terrae C-6]|uniref:IstB domain-containing protein ATP-binding protein n=5 Tax=Gordonia TaxID=2053 RepID=R7Y2Y0_9ACTN|nr:AFG1/ZapE family ATPase [Gordonia terrae]EON30337.1 IstB domain-containing protein ATP-binding protein [Gordonia terrae C-6]